MCGGSAETNIPSRHSSKYKCNYWWMQTLMGVGVNFGEHFL